MRKFLRPIWRVLPLLALLFAAHAPAHAELAAVWAVDDGAKITATAPERTPDRTLDHPLARGNGIFSAQPPRIRLFALRNETVAFQVILAGGHAETPGVTATLEAIGPMDNQGATDDPDRYFVGRHIEIFEQHYVEVRMRSHELAWLPGSAAEPAGPTGWVPDALVPHRGPLVVPAQQNRGLWIDVYVPHDAPAGVHRGTLTIRVQGAVCTLPACTLPIELEVLPMALPDAPPVKTMLWASIFSPELDQAVARYFDHTAPIPPDALHALRARHFKLARRHRITLVSGEEEAPDADLAALLTGQAFTAAAGYAGPGQDLGQDVYPIHMYGGRLTPDQAQRWSAWLAEHGPGVEHFLYVHDEPGDDALIPVLNAAAAAARPVPSFVTTPYDPRYAMDIFAVPTRHYARAVAAEAAAQGRRLWVYNGVRPYAGSFLIDDVAISPRVNPWIQYRYRVPRWFYWEATYYQDFQGGRSHIDVFSEAMNFSNRHGDQVLGDGLLMYPGRDRIFPAQDRGIDGPLPSIRLKNWRRGIEDIGYLELARQAGHGAFVDALLATMVPRALAHGVREDEPVAWPEDGERWLAARRSVFELLKTGQPPHVDWAALARPAEPFWSRAQRQLGRWATIFVGSPRRIAATAAAAGLGLALAAWLVIRRLRSRQRAQERP